MMMGLAGLITEATMCYCHHWSQGCTSMLHFDALQSSAKPCPSEWPTNKRSSIRSSSTPIRTVSHSIHHHQRRLRAMQHKKTAWIGLPWTMVQCNPLSTDIMQINGSIAVSIGMHHSHFHSFSVHVPFILLKQSMFIALSRRCQYGACCAKQ